MTYNVFGGTLTTLFYLSILDALHTLSVQTSPTLNWAPEISSGNGIYDIYLPQAMTARTQKGKY